MLTFKHLHLTSEPLLKTSEMLGMQVENITEANHPKVYR
jgi:hypothetical protein